jgi:hypothetical protein
MRTNYCISCFYFGCPWGRTVHAPKYSPPHVQRVKERPRRNVVSLVVPVPPFGSESPPRDKTVPAPCRSRRNNHESSSQHMSMQQRRASTSSFLVEGGGERPTTAPVRLVSSLDGAPSPSQVRFDPSPIRRPVCLYSTAYLARPVGRESERSVDGRSTVPREGHGLT